MAAKKSKPSAKKQIAKAKKQIKQSEKKLVAAIKQTAKRKNGNKTTIKKEIKSLSKIIKRTARRKNANKRATIKAIKKSKKVAEKTSKTLKKIIGKLFRDTKTGRYSSTRTLEKQKQERKQKRELKKQIEKQKESDYILHFNYGSKSNHNFIRFEVRMTAPSSIKDDEIFNIVRKFEQKGTLPDNVNIDAITYGHREDMPADKIAPIHNRGAIIWGAAPSIVSKGTK